MSSSTDDLSFFFLFCFFLLLLLLFFNADINECVNDDLFNCTDEFHICVNTRVNVVKTCTLSMENAEVIYQFRGSVSVHMLSKLKSPLPSVFFKTALARIKIIFLLLIVLFLGSNHS